MSNEIDRLLSERDALRRQLTEARKEADEYGRWLDQAHNERDALASALEESRAALAEISEILDGNEDTTRMRWVAHEALSKPLPHHVERVRLRDAVVEAARRLRGSFVGVNAEDCEKVLFTCLAALDVHEKEQADGL